MGSDDAEVFEASICPASYIKLLVVMLSVWDRQRT